MWPMVAPSVCFCDTGSSVRDLEVSSSGLSGQEKRRVSFGAAKPHTTIRPATEFRGLGVGLGGRNEVDPPLTRRGIFPLIPGNQLMASGPQSVRIARGDMASILVVDDNSDVRKVVSQALEFAGHEVAIAEDGWTAIIGFRRRGADLVIMDVSSSEPECHRTISEIRSLGGRVKVLAMSGGTDIVAGESWASISALGADGLLPKPFALLDLLVAVDGLLPNHSRRRLTEAS